MKPLLVVAALLVLLGDADGSLSLSVLECDHNFFSGEKIERTLVVRNDTMETKKAVVAWKTLVPPAVIEQGERRISMEELQGQVHRITLKMPEARWRLTLVWKIQLLCDGKPSVEKQFDYSVFSRDIPDKAGDFAADRKLALFDPSRQVERILRDLNVSFTCLPGQSSLESFKGELVIIGTGEGAGDMLNAAAVLNNVRRRGLSVICFHPGHDEDRFAPPLPDLSRRHPGLTRSSIVAPGHPVFDELDDNDLSNWRGDGIVSRLAVMEPTGGNYRVLAEGELSTAPLFEVMCRGNRIIFCQLMVVEKFNVEPVARLLFVNLLRYALARQEPLRTAVIYGEPGGETVKALDSMGVAQDPAGKSSHMIICADEESAAFIKKNPSRISMHMERLVTGGGLILFIGPFTEAMSFLKACGKNRYQDTALRDGDDEDRRNRGITALGRGSPALWGMNAEAMNLLDTGGKAVKFPLGRAEVFICQPPPGGYGPGSLATLSQLLTNLGVRIGVRTHEKENV